MPFFGYERHYLLVPSILTKFLDITVMPCETLPMSTYHYPAENFNHRLLALAERIERGVTDDHNANLLKSIHKIASFADDYRSVYCLAIKRVIEAERTQ